MTTRRDLLKAFGTGALLVPLISYAREPARIPRIGVIVPLTNLQQRNAFREGLREHGWIEGRNIIVEYRDAAGNPQQRTEIAREFIDLKVDCIVAGGNVAVNALKQVTSSVPIVMTSAADAVGSKFIASLSRPGGNITGLTNIMEALTAKRLELLKALSSRISLVAVLRDPTVGPHNTAWKEAEAAARSMGFRVLAADFHVAEDFETAFAAIAREKADGLMVLQSPAVTAARLIIAGLAAKQRLPAIYQDSFFVEAGGLMLYGPDISDLWRRSARYVDRILKGARPAELPVEQPTKFDLVVNLKTAKALGLVIPQSIRVRADRVIE